MYVHLKQAKLYRWHFCSFDVQEWNIQWYFVHWFHLLIHHGWLHIHHRIGFAHMITSCISHQKLIAFSEIVISQIFKWLFFILHLKWRKLKWESIDNSATICMINLIVFYSPQRDTKWLRWRIARHKSTLRGKIWCNKMCNFLMWCNSFSTLNHKVLWKGKSAFKWGCFICSILF